jgi:polysaccharide biosynthesis/export protein
MRSGGPWAVVMLGLMTPAAALGQQAQPAQVEQAEQYRINSGDELEIYVWGEERLQRTVKVLPDGTMAFPLVGQIVAQGMLPRELETAISSRLQGQYRGEVPQVTVSVVAPSGMQFSVMGRVRSPGTFTPGRYVTVLEALSMAGGPNEFANLDNVLVIRKEGERVRAFRLRLGAVFRGGSNLDESGALASIATIQPGDTVIVP